jgi:hypothetical protein
MLLHCFVAICGMAPVWLLELNFRFELRLQSVVISQLLYLHFIRMYNVSFKVV